MWNVLLDSLPEDWEGFPIDTDFQTGIQISQCMADEELSNTEKLSVAAKLLFVGQAPAPGKIAEAIHWYLTEYDHDDHRGDKEPNAPVMDWDIDQWRIYSAFLQQYGIDLNRTKMHWFVFMGLLANLEECVFTGVMNIRQKKINSNMSQEEKNAIRSAQKVFSIKPKNTVLSSEEQARLNDFMKYANIKKKDKEPRADSRQ